MRAAGFETPSCSVAPAISRRTGLTCPDFRIRSFHAMRTSTPSRLQWPWRWLLALSILIILAGALTIVTPRLEGLDAHVLVAGLLLLVSALHLAFAWPFRPTPAVLWQALLSVAYGAIGLYLLGRSDLSADSIRLPVTA